jgi:hypothetical protein
MHSYANLRCTHETKLVFNTPNQTALLRKLDIFPPKSLNFKTFFRFVGLEHFFLLSKWFFDAQNFAFDVTQFRELQQ